MLNLWLASYSDTILKYGKHLTVLDVLLADGILYSPENKKKMSILV